MITNQIVPGSVAVIILTYNEQCNLAQALDSVLGWANEIFILDSGSTDSTMDIAKGYNCHVLCNKFQNYAKQRNFALDNFHIKSEWCLFLDADEWVTSDLKLEIDVVLGTVPKHNGFYIKRRHMWMGRWIRRGYYPTWILRLFRTGKGRCEDRAVNEHIIVEGEIGRLRSDFIHEDRKDVSDWIVKHNNYAYREAVELLNPRDMSGYQEIEAKLLGTQAERKRWIRYKIWNHLPPLIRPFFYFFYRYVLMGGFLDGREAFIYHFLQGLWYPLLIDVKYLEMKKKLLK